MDLVTYALAKKYTDQAIAEGGGMEFFVVTVSGGQIVHNGTAMDYYALKEKFDDPKAFLYMDYQNLIWIPAIDAEIEGNPAIAFSVAWTRNDEGNERPYISRVILNAEGDLKYSQDGLESVDYKVDSFEDYDELTEAERSLLYPSMKAVHDYLNETIGVIENGSY